MLTVVLFIPEAGCWIEMAAAEILALLISSTLPTMLPRKFWPHSTAWSGKNKIIKNAADPKVRKPSGLVDCGDCFTTRLLLDSTPLPENRSPAKRNNDTGQKLAASSR